MSWIYRLLGNPFIYKVAQLIFAPGARKKLHSIIQKEVGGRELKSILDLGCGPGMFSDVGDGYYGVDNNVHYLRELSKRGKLCSAMDVVALGFKDNVFDCVLSVNLLHHLQDNDVRMAINEGLRVLKPDGKLIIIDSILPTLRSNLIAWAIRKMDRGKYVRGFKSMLSLLQGYKLESYTFNYSLFSLDGCVVNIKK